MIELKNVTFSYINYKQKPAIRNMNLTIPDGQILLLCGQSGCGKTTMTRLINGLIPHFYEGTLEGRVLVNGREIAACPLYELAPLIGSVFQNPKSQFYTVESDSELVFASENVAMNKTKIQQNFQRTVNEYQIQKLLGKNLFQMSGGEKQKIACASVSILSPDIIVMDEPTSNLDQKAIKDLRKIVAKWKKEKKTVIISEHRLSWLNGLADRIVYLDRGNIQRDWTMEQFLAIESNELKGLGLRSNHNMLERPLAPMQEQVKSCTETNSIQIENFSYSYISGQPALQIDHLSIPQGAIVGILGENGAGKSTFAKCLCGLTKNCKGTVRIYGKIADRKQRIRSSYLVMQDVNHQLFTESVWDEMCLSMTAFGKSQQKTQKQAKDLLDKLELTPYIDAHPMSLSGGQKQRVAIASALLADKELLIFDEPTSGLDYRSMINVANLLSNMKHFGNTQLIISHDEELITQCCDYLIFLKNGQMKWAGSLNEAITQGKVDKRKRLK